MSTVRATFYAQIVGTKPQWAAADSPPTGAKAVRITQKAPESPEPGCVVAKLTIEVPAAAFMPLVLEVRRDLVYVVTPAEFLDQPVTATATDPREES